MKSKNQDINDWIKSMGSYCAGDLFKEDEKLKYERLWVVDAEKLKYERLWVVDAEKTLYPFLSKSKYKCATYHLICPLCHRKTICYSETTVKVIGEGSIVLGMCCDCDFIFLGDNE